MKVQIILIDECGTEVIAETLEAKTVEAMGEHLDAFVRMRIAEIEDSYPECRGVYREDIKSIGEQRCEEYEALYQENLEWALAHEDELDGYDPYEWADEQTRNEMDNQWW